MLVRFITKTFLLFAFFPLFCATLAAQHDNNLFKTIPPTDIETPAWAHEMYSDRPNVWLVDSLYEAYYRVVDFQKNTHTQNYKHWRKQIAQHHWIDDQGNLKIPSVAEQQALDARWLRQRDGAHRTRSMNNISWEPIGPFETWDGTQWISKQVNVYTLDQSVSDPNIVFCGTETGGIYKSVDKGETWSNIGDDLILGGIGSIKIHPENPDTVYMGEGSNLYRSSDGGSTWATVHTASNLNVRDILFVPPTGVNHYIVLAATQLGLMRSTNGGATWTFVVTPQCWDLELKPGSRDTVYLLQTNVAAQHIRFYRSVNKGVSFTEYNTGWYAGSLTLDNSTRGARMAVTAADPDYIYVALLGSDTSYTQDNNWIGVYKSVDAGSAWSLPAGDPGGPYSEEHYCLSSFHPWFQWGGNYDQGYYNLGIAVSTSDPESIMVGCLNLWKSNDGGATYEGIGGYFGGISGYSHPDVQEIEINGDDVWVATDGGIDLYDADLTSKVSLNNGINSSDYWGFGSGWNTDVLVGGRYHNGNAAMHQSYPEGKSLSLGGGEASTGYVNQGFPRKVYHSDVGGKLLPEALDEAVTNIANLGKYPNESYVNENKGELEPDPRCFNHLYLTHENGLWKSTNAGISFGLIKSFGTDITRKATGFEVSRSNPDVIYVCQRVSGASKIWKTLDGGMSWSELTLPTTQTGGGIFITLSPEDADLLYMAASNGGSNTDKVFMTSDGGDTWTNLTTSVLDGHYPEHIMVAGGTDGGVYVATNYSVFYYSNTLGDWQLVDDGLPARTSTMLIRPFYKDGALRIATTNRGIWSTPFYEEFDPVVQPTVDKLQSFCSRDTFYFDDFSMVKHDGTTWEWEFSPAPEWVDDLDVRNPKVVFGNDGSFDVTLTLHLEGGGTASKQILEMVTLESHCEADTVPGQALRTFADGDYGVAQNVNLTDITHFTVTGWWKPNGGQPGFGAIFSSGDWCAHCDYTEGLIVDYFGTRLWYKWPGNAANWGSNSGMTIPIDQWSYVALVIEPEGATLYLNEQKYVHNIPLDPGNIESFYLGYGHYSHSFIGDIDEVTIWKRALSEHEIRSLRHLTREDVIIDDPDLIAYYQFNELYSDQILDHAGIYHGALNAGAVLTGSTAPVGGGVSHTENITGAGEVGFGETGVVLTFAEGGTYPDGDLVVSRLNVPPDTSATEEVVQDSLYWIINNYGNNSFTELLSIGFAGLPDVHPLITDLYTLYKRNSNASGDTWGGFIDRGDTVISSVLIFAEGNGITSFSQFMIGSEAACVTVVNSSDDGPGSLREAISCVTAGGTVVFHPSIDGDTIHLASELLLKKDLRIAGRGSANTVIDGSLVPHAVVIQPDFAVWIAGLSVIGGTAESGRAIFNEGDLILQNLDLYDHPTLPNTDNALLVNNSGSGIVIKENVLISQD